MTDEARTSSLTPDGLCPWCSTAVAGDPERCPACGASLRANVEAMRAADPVIPGLTEIDPALVRKPAPARQRSLMAWITGDTASDEAGPPADPASLAPPPDDVRLEMLRLKVDALRTGLEAEAAAARTAAELEAAELEAANRQVPPADVPVEEAGDGAA